MPLAPRAIVLGIADLTDDTVALGQFIHWLGWQRGEHMQSILRLGAAIAAIALIIVIVGDHPKTS